MYHLPNALPPSPMYFYGSCNVLLNWITKISWIASHGRNEMNVAKIGSGKKIHFRRKIGEIDLDLCFQSLTFISFPLLFTSSFFILFYLYFFKFMSFHLLFTRSIFLPYFVFNRFLSLSFFFCFSDIFIFCCRR